MVKLANQEQRVAARVVGLLAEMGWDVYQEVQHYADGPVADIVAVKGSLVWIVEAKASRSIAVIDQALGWEGCANLISVATPPVQRRGARLRGRSAWTYLLDSCGLGWFESGTINRWPRLRRKTPSDIRKHLCEEHKTECMAGAAGGGYWTPFRGTVKRLLAAVENEPGIALKVAVKEIEHHYASDAGAVSTLRRHINDGVIEGVSCVRGKLYPEPPARKRERKPTTSRLPPDLLNRGKDGGDSE